jgi:hypothetical protein
MSSEKKEKKLPYEPPKIYELDVDMSQAMGQTSCSRGNTASSTCSRGNSATMSCSRGSAATSYCNTGGSYVPACNPGMGF